VFPTPLISRDPSGFDFGPNVDAYCDDDPINFFDATGCGPNPRDDDQARLARAANGPRPYPPL